MIGLIYTGGVSTFVPPSGLAGFTITGTSALVYTLIDSFI
jgi:hypothetical protein